MYIVQISLQKLKEYWKHFVFQKSIPYKETMTLFEWGSSIAHWLAHLPSVPRVRIQNQVAIVQIWFFEDQN